MSAMHRTEVNIASFLGASMAVITTVNASSSRLTTSPQQRQQQQHTQQYVAVASAATTMATSHASYTVPRAVAAPAGQKTAATVSKQQKLKATAGAYLSSGNTALKQEWSEF